MAAPPSHERGMHVHEAVAARRSIRAFLPEAIPQETLRRIFERAQRAPSWCNIQPWRVWIASGDACATLKKELVEAAGSKMPCPDVTFPVDYPEPYLTHRRACGKALYEAMGVKRDDGPGRQAAWMRNFVAFDAPHVAIVAFDKRFAIWAALDIGCWLDTVMLLAEEEGYATCAQASLSLYPDVLRARLGIGDDVTILFGIGLGKPDPDAAANRCVTTREPVETNVKFV
jgi:nitroreductase